MLLYRIMAIENFQKVLQQPVNKSVKAKLKKRLGLPPARNIGSKETKLAMKRLDRRMKTIKHLRFLWKRGILKRGQKIPRMPDKQVEASDSQTAPRRSFETVEDSLKRGLHHGPCPGRAAAAAAAAPAAGDLHRGLQRNIDFKTQFLFQPLNSH